MTTGDDIANAAYKYLGDPYKYGGNDPETGLDCSAFVQRAYNDCGIALPRTSTAQSRVGTTIDGIANAGVGDLVFYGAPIHHVGIYLGAGKFIEAPHTGDVVKIASVGTPSKIQRIVPPGVGTPNTGATAVLTAVTKADPAAETDDASGVATLIDPHTWLRVAVFVGGGALLVFGLLIMGAGGAGHKGPVPGSPMPRESEATPDASREVPATSEATP